MAELKLKSNGTAYQDAIFAYLKSNVSEELAKKINVGKKTLDGCFKYIMQCARKEAKGGCACIEDKVVFGWAIHYFEEDKIEEEIKEMQKNNTQTVKKIEKKPEAKSETKVEKKSEKKSDMLEGQITLFDMFGGGK